MAGLGPQAEISFAGTFFSSAFAACFAEVRLGFDLIAFEFDC